MTTNEITAEGDVVCPYCGNAIDPEVCHCGTGRKVHGFETGHNFVPMGCSCGYVADKEPVFELKKKEKEKAQ